MSYKNKKEEIVAGIEKDKISILGYWSQAKMHYERCNSASTIKLKIEQNDLQREWRMKAMEVAMDNYHSDFFLHNERNSIIGENFSEFWDFLHWWLKDVGINGDEWNELDNEFHRIRIKYPKEFEKYSKYSPVNNPKSPEYKK